MGVRVVGELMTAIDELASPRRIGFQPASNDEACESSVVFRGSVDEALGQMQVTVGVERERDLWSRC
jgi:hypothetical protein